MGEKDAAFANLERAAAEGQSLDNFKLDPTLDPLRSDPRFADLLRRIDRRSERSRYSVSVQTVQGSRAHTSPTAPDAEIRSPQNLQRTEIFALGLSPRIPAGGHITQLVGQNISGQGV